MSKPQMIRAVWLTLEQRTKLLAIVEESCQRTQKREVNELLVELQNLDHKKLASSGLVKTFVVGLRMPNDALPVSLCTEAVNQMQELGTMTPDLLKILCPDQVKKTGGKK